MFVASRYSNQLRLPSAARGACIVISSLVLFDCRGSTGSSDVKTAPNPSYDDSGAQPDAGANAPLGPIAISSAPNASGFGGTAMHDQVPGNPAAPPPNGGTDNGGWGGSGAQPGTGKVPIGSIATPSNSR